MYQIYFLAPLFQLQWPSAVMAQRGFSYVPQTQLFAHD